MKFGLRSSFQKWILLSYFSIALVLCTLFSYPLSPDFSLDLRVIPFLIGGLYFRLSPYLGVLLILLRGYHGIDSGFYIGLAFYTLFIILIWKISPKFLKLSSNSRIFFSTLITMIHSILIIIYLEMNGLSYNPLDVWFAYLVVPPLGVAMSSYIVEMIQKNHQIQLQMVKAEKLEAIEQMGAAISHEIRNPLTTAIGFADLLEKDSFDPEKEKIYLSILKDELESAERVIQDFLMYSKPVMDKVEKLNVRNELLYVLKLLQPLSNLHSVKVITNFSTDGIIEGDRQNFHQCFISILKNSIEAMPNGGTLTIETERLSSKIYITIADSGIGMNEKQLKRLGQPYYSSQDLKTKGFGVMNAYHIIRSMNGTIDVQSQIGKGTVFTFSFRHLTSKSNRFLNIF